ncbi:putative S-adenosyl-L-methionine-dependent methyltransferase [Blattamonas nauphoetae]|uniref:S-adenosyl-L-methionine-dependent methyltransferase n=1 Tax=Blattamonas nauphoetae TaxID=2049346 RepID=A0ABQ9YKP6_9EUKA|nr:putative S-adenosyl-L-methionine-dependent methyltransferase [Blattamonas nauphoetae]
MSIRLKQLQSRLEQLDGFQSPDIALEQYNTPAYVAAHLLLHAMELDCIVGKNILDLGCGPGILGIGAKILDALTVTSVDIDDSALSIAQSNAEHADVSIEFIRADVFESLPTLLLPQIINAKLSLSDTPESEFPVLQSPPTLPLFDTVLMNPPFGTRKSGADLEFLRIACLLCQGSVFSLHKSSTRKHIVNTVKKWGLSCTPVGQYDYQIDAMYSFHKQDRVSVEVDLLRIDCSGMKEEMAKLINLPSGQVFQGLPIWTDCQLSGEKPKKGREKKPTTKSKRGKGRR